VAFTIIETEASFVFYIQTRPISYSRLIKIYQLPVIASDKKHIFRGSQYLSHLKSYEKLKVLAGNVQIRIQNSRSLDCSCMNKI